MQYNQDSPKHTFRGTFLSLLVILVSLALLLISCTSSSKKSTPNKVPTVSLTANPKTGEAALEVTFTATSNDPDGDSLTISWDFGDGQTEQGQTQRKHTYQNSGVYTVKVDVSDGKGGTASDSTQITVTAKNNDPEVTLTADKTSGIAPLTVNFTANASDVDNDNLTFSWDFGDGEDLDNQSTEGVEKKQNHTYDKAGTYTAKVTVSDDKGNSASDSVEITVESQPSNKPPTVSLSATPTSGEASLNVEFTANGNDPDGDTLTYSWDFGDGNKTGSKSKETHIYNNAGTFTAKVTVSDGKGGSATDSTEITVKAVPKNNPPTVSLSATPTNGTSPLTVEFTADASDADNDPLTYSWDFGDGDKTGDKNKETHIYQQEGTYTAKVTVSDGNGGQSSDTIEIKVNKPPKSNNPPTVQLDATPKTGDSPLAVEFTITANDPDGDSLTIDWDFGDNQTAQGQTSRNHTYQNAGNYTAKVTVSDGKGGTANDTVQITVNQPPPTNKPPTVELSSSETEGAAPLAVTLTATASDPDNDSLTYDWDFGDGEMAQGQASRNHTYQNAGTFTAKVTVSDGKGGTDSSTVQIKAIQVQDGDAEIQCIRYDPIVGPDTGNEYVDVKALGAVDFSGWYLEDLIGNRVSAPDVTATFGQVVRFQGDKAIWNNDGDTAKLYDSNGILKDQVSYSGGGSIVCR